MIKIIIILIVAVLVGFMVYIQAPISNFEKLENITQENNNLKIENELLKEKLIQINKTKELECSIDLYKLEKFCAND